MFLLCFPCTILKASQFLTNKRRHRCQETIGKRFSINLLYHIRIFHLVLFHELLLQGKHHRITQDKTEERLAYCSSATLISQDIAQRWNSIQNMFTIIQTTIGSSTQNYSDTFLMTKNGTSSPEHVTSSQHLISIEDLAQQGCHDRNLRPVTPLP